MLKLWLPGFNYKLNFNCQSINQSINQSIMKTYNSNQAGSMRFPRYNKNANLSRLAIEPARSLDTAIRAVCPNMHINTDLRAVFATQQADNFICYGYICCTCGGKINNTNSI